jgi:hypothetical protein
LVTIPTLVLSAGIKNSVTAGGSFALAIDSDPRNFCYTGNNTYGQLGNGDPNQLGNGISNIVVFGFNCSNPNADRTAPQASVKNPEVAGSHNFNVYPNPATETVTLEYTVATDNSEVGISVYNAIGMKISDIIDKYTLSKGDYSKTINVREWGLKPGAYLIKCTIDRIIQTKKIIVLN